MRWGLVGLVGVTGAGTAGYRMLGLGWLDALYQTVTTISTVGFRELAEYGTNGKIFTIVLILIGVGATLYTMTMLLETLVEGRLTDLFGRRRMQRQIDQLRGHVVVCGWGRVGRATSEAVHRHQRGLVVIDQDPERAATVPHLQVLGDAADETVLRQAGLDRATVLVAALNTDADNLYVTLTGRALNPDLFIIARARSDNAEHRLIQAGANRVVNPQKIGGDRMAAFALQPHVAEFLDVVMHDANLEFRLEEVTVHAGSALAGRTLREAHIRDDTGAMVLAVRDGARFNTNPPPDTTLDVGQVLIAIGQPSQLQALAQVAGESAPTASLD